MKNFREILYVKMSFYAIAKGKEIGIFNTWAECKMHTDGFKGAIFKKFLIKDEAEKFILDNTSPNKKSVEKEFQIKIHDTSIVEKPLKTEGNAFDILMKPRSEPDYYVYTDGACSNNGRTDAVAGIGIYFSENDPRNVSARIEGKQTNNTAELGAFNHLYPIIESDIISGKDICIVSDSEYAIRCVTTYGKRCYSEGWIKDIPNKDLVKETFNLYKDSNVRFLHIKAHTGKQDVHSLGNDKADELANMAAGITNEKIYLNIPYSKKDEVKALGARWDSINKKWFITDTMNKTQFSKYIESA